MKFKSGDQVKILFPSAFGQIGIIVEFSRYNSYGHECYWIKRKTEEKWAFHYRDETSRNDGMEQSFCESWFTLIKPKNAIKPYGIVKFLEEK